MAENATLAAMNVRWQRTEVRRLLNGRTYPKQHHDHDVPGGLGVLWTADIVDLPEGIALANEVAALFEGMSSVRIEIEQILHKSGRSGRGRKPIVFQRHNIPLSHAIIISRLPRFECHISISSPQIGLDDAVDITAQLRLPYYQAAEFALPQKVVFSAFFGSVTAMASSSMRWRRELTKVLGDMKPSPIVSITQEQILLAAHPRASDETCPVTRRPQV
jgi:hypothetical protein